MAVISFSKILGDGNINLDCTFSLTSLFTRYRYCYRWWNPRLSKMWWNSRLNTKAKEAAFIYCLLVRFDCSSPPRNSCLFGISPETSCLPTLHLTPTPTVPLIDLPTTRCHIRKLYFVDTTAGSESKKGTAVASCQLPLHPFPPHHVPQPT